MSAVLSQLHTAADPLATAVADYVLAKRQEDEAKKNRLAAEDRILALQPAKEEGALTVEAGGYKVTLTGALSYSADDIEALRNVTARWDGNLVPLKTTTVLDSTGCRYIRRERPDLWQQLARVITVKPAKTAIKVSV
jgi:hypothetical protein